MKQKVLFFKIHVLLIVKAEKETKKTNGKIFSTATQALRSIDGEIQREDKNVKFMFIE